MGSKRFLLMVALLMMAAFASESVLSKASATQTSQEQQAVNRDLKTPSLQSGPLEIFNLKINGKEVAGGQKVIPDEEWAKGVSFDVKNISDKVITHIGFSLVSRNPDGKSFALLFSHGRGTMMPEVKPTVRVMPDEVIHATYSDKPNGGFRLMNGPIGVVIRKDGALAIGDVAFELDIESVMFEDDTMWKPGGPMGDYFRRDPSDPRRWNVIK